MNLIEKLIIGWNFLTLKLLFEKVINNNYNISEFKFISHSKNLFIDGFSLEYGNFNCFQKVMMYHRLSNSKPVAYNWLLVYASIFINYKLVLIINNRWYIKKVYVKYDCNAIITILKKPIGY